MTEPQPESLTAWTAEAMRAHFLPAPTAFAEAIERLAVEDGLSLPFLSEPLCQYLLKESESLSYRPAMPEVGGEGRRVYQDFELTMAFEADSPFWRFAKALDGLTDEALGLLKENPCPGMFHNDLIIQRYQAGCAGITPHRDHIRYQGLVSLFVLGGEGDFYLCKDRSGSGARHLPAPPGSLILMRGAGFAGLSERPFHMLKDIKSYRVSLGLRWDTRPGTPH